MAVKRTMQLFGAPYQFTDAVDPRIQTISTDIGQNFMRNIMAEAPICTIIPGEPKYLPTVGSDEEKEAVTHALAQCYLDDNGGFSSLIKDSKILNNELRLYDFKRTYSEYMKYVNILCRAGAVMLELGGVTLPGQDVPLANMDWRNYRGDGSSYGSLLSSFGSAGNDLKKMISEGWSQVKSSVKNAFSLDTITGYSYDTDEDGNETGKTDYDEDTLSGSGYVQFYVDPDASCDESMSNSAGDSMIKGIFDSSQNFIKEFSFLANSGGAGDIAETFQEFTAGTLEAMNTVISKVGDGTQVGSVLSRIINLSGSVLRGQNMILPQIYQSSSYTKSYSIQVHLKTPYGSKLGYYLNIFVPLMHLIALAVPRQATANTYESPFLVKAYVDGIFSCNMGMVDSISISRGSDSRSVEGLPSEVDVSLSIVDLYSQLTLSSSANPSLFVTNASLIEFLATNCGLNIIGDNVKTKVDLFISAYSNAIRDIPTNIGSGVHEYLDNVVAGFTSLMY